MTACKGEDFNEPDLSRLQKVFCCQRLTAFASDPGGLSITEALACESRPQAESRDTPQL
jgi:hypothetical protein